MPYHVNDRGEPGLCQAAHACPFGDADAHASTPEAARSAYELRMNASTVPARASVERQIQNPTTPGSLAAMSVQAEPEQLVKDSQECLIQAGKLASSHLHTIWDRQRRRYTDADLGTFIHDVSNKQASAIFDLLEAEYALSQHDVAGAVARLASCEAKLKTLGNGASARMLTLWNADTRTYTDGAQASFLHDLINAQAKSMSRARFARRDLERAQA